MGASTIATRNSRRQSKSISSTITSIVSKSLLVGSVQYSIVANISPHRKKRRILLSYAFRSNFLGSPQATSLMVAPTSTIEPKPLSLRVQPETEYPAYDIEIFYKTGRQLHIMSDVMPPTPHEATLQVWADAAFAAQENSSFFCSRSLKSTQRYLCALFSIRKRMSISFSYTVPPLMRYNPLKNTPTSRWENHSTHGCIHIL